MTPTKILKDGFQFLGNKLEEVRNALLLGNKLDEVRNALLSKDVAVNLGDIDISSLLTEITKQTKILERDGTPAMLGAITALQHALEKKDMATLGATSLFFFTLSQTDIR